MRVENPWFEDSGDVYCSDCPFDGEHESLDALCIEMPCPTAETYLECCLMAEAAKGGKE